MNKNWRYYENKYKTDDNNYYVKNNPYMGLFIINTQKDHLKLANA